MSMNFWLETGVSITIVALVLYLCFMVIPRSQKVRDFFYKNRKYLSPDCISNWRKYLGAPVIGFFVFGMFIENNVITYIAIWMFVFLAITDLLDGVVARACDLATEKGARLDAEADKWFDLSALFALSLFPVFKPIYLIIVIPIAIFDIIGQKIRGKNSPPEAGIIGKIKTTVKFIVIYLMTFTERYTEIYDILKLDIIILILLFLALILAGLSMGMKTKWYRDYIRKYLEEYFA